MLLAVMAPVESDGPVAVTQSPTARAAAVADSVSVTVVDDDTAMVMSVGGTVVVGIELVVLDLKLNPESLTPSTTNEPDPTETSLPLMMAALASPPAKPGPLPVGKLRGGVFPVENPPPPPPRPNPPAPRPKPDGQPPDDVGWVTVTDRAVTVESDVVPMTITQVPDVSDETVKVAVLENRVEEVQSTVSCPVVAFCTSIDVPEMAATEPDVPGNLPPPPPPDPFGAAGAVVELELVEALEEPPPHAARVTVRAAARVVITTDLRLARRNVLIWSLFVVGGW